MSSYRQPIEIEIPATMTGAVETATIRKLSFREVRLATDALEATRRQSVEQANRHLADVLTVMREHGELSEAERGMLGLTPPAAPPVVTEAGPDGDVVPAPPSSSPPETPDGAAPPADAATIIAHGLVAWSFEDAAPTDVESAADLPPTLIAWIASRIWAHTHGEDWEKNSPTS